MEIALALGLVIVAITLLSIDRLPIEVSSLSIVVLAVLTGLVGPEEALAGFSSETAIFIFALLALTQGLAATGVMQLIGRRLLYFTRFGPHAFVVPMLIVVTLFSSVASNTAVTAAFLPVITAASVQTKIPPSKLLMPMAFCSMLGGMILLFGTSTNLVISGAMESFGLGRIGFAELTPVGLPLAAFGLVLIFLVGRRLLPARESALEDSSLSQREYVTELVLTPGSRLVGRTLREVGEVLGVPVLGLVRDDAALPCEPGEVVLADDHLVISGTLSEILRVRDLRSVRLLSDLRNADDRGPTVLVEVSVPPTSALEGRSLRAMRFADRYGLVAVAIYRHPSLQHSDRELDLLDSLTGGEDMKNIPLSVGDMLLLSGPEPRVRELARDEELTVLGAIEYQRPRYGRAVLAVVIFACTVIVAGLRLASPAVVGLTGLLVMLATACVDSRTAFRVDWRVIIMIGALLTLGLAMENSGAGDFLARGILPLAGTIGPRGLLAVQMLLTVLLSIPMSNQAAALIMLPVGINVAGDLGLDPRTFAIGTCLAASCSFATPFEPAAALVYGPGRYRVSDFLRVGTPLTLLMLILLTFAVPLVWPFTR